MAIDRSALIILHGGCGASEPERMVGAVRVATARRLAEVAHEAGLPRIIIATDAPSAFEGRGAIIDGDGSERFDLQSRVLAIVRSYDLESVVVAGSGALPLATVESLAPVIDFLRGKVPGVITNNFFSADFSAWRPAEAIAGAVNLMRDNAIPRRLRDDCGLQSTILPRSIATQFDIDTPGDVAVLSLTPNLPAAIARACEPVAALANRYRKLLPLLCDRDAEVVVAGRVGSHVWQHIERETACRVRMFAEERGMAAAGPGHRARAALGFLLEAVGPEGFFSRMAELGDALVLDARVIEAHLGLTPSREDRFRSDLFDSQRVSDTWLREFTEAAAKAPIPVLLGGHSLVTGGLMVLTDVAWTEHDALAGTR